MTPVRTILAVEDSDDDFDTIQTAYQNWSKRHPDHALTLRRLENGEECYKCLENNSGSFQSLVLLDLNLPGIGGRKTLQMIKTAERLKSVPVVILSSSSNSADVSFCHTNGANAYHVKPFHYEEFLDLMDKVFDYWSTAVTHNPNKP